MVTVVLAIGFAVQLATLGGLGFLLWRDLKGRDH